MRDVHNGHGEGAEEVGDGASHAIQQQPHVLGNHLPQPPPENKNTRARPTPNLINKTQLPNARRSPADKRGPRPRRLRYSPHDVLGRRETSVRTLAGQGRMAKRLKS